MNCEECGNTIPIAEHGVMLGVDEHWNAIAPRPNQDLFASGLLCLSCMDTRLQEKVGVTLAQSLAEDCTLAMKAPATDAIVEVLPLDVIDSNIDTLEGLVEWLSDKQYERFIERIEVETTTTERTA